MILGIISHTRHYNDAAGQVKGWFSTVTEINELCSIFTQIIHFAPLHEDNPPSSTEYYKDKVTFIPLKPSGGAGIKKLQVIPTSLINLKTIDDQIDRCDVIQFRAPTGMGLFVLPYLKYRSKKPYWVKYAGNWVSDNAPLANKLQRWWLKNLLDTDQRVTVNGSWEGESRHIIAFENPCLTEKDRELGATMIQNKKISSGKDLHFCFIGSLNDNKGLPELMCSINTINKKRNIRFHIVGGGNKEGEYMAMLDSKSMELVTFHGHVNRESLESILQYCHFLILPSRSEGFPKVIGEAMNYGLVPIVSDISCISQYVQNGMNGYLIPRIKPEVIAACISRAASLSKDKFAHILGENYQMARIFTYSHFKNRITELVKSITD